MALKQLDFRLGEDKVPFFIGHNQLIPLLQQLQQHFADEGFDHIFIGYDTNTAIHCAPKLERALNQLRIPFKSCTIGVAEESKTVSTLDHVLETFLKQGGSRRTIVMPVGGGIVSNLFGLVSGLLFRGIRLVQMPSTFLNAHDAVTSKKQAVNHAGYKNIVGMFHTPRLVLVDTGYFETLGQQEFKSGLGELTKNAALFGGEHYELMQRTVLDHGWNITPEEQVEAVYSGIKAKDALLAIDPKEKELALLFEYGHTVGHALELTEGITTSHGEGVTIGMLAASHVAYEMGIMSAEDRAEHDALVEALEPAIDIPNRDCFAEVMDKVLHDNKRGYTEEREGFVPMILAKRIGEMHRPCPTYLEYVPQPILEEVIKQLLTRFGPYDYYDEHTGRQVEALDRGKRTQPQSGSRNERNRQVWDQSREEVLNWASVSMEKTKGSEGGRRPKL